MNRLLSCPGGSDAPIVPRCALVLLLLTTSVGVWRSADIGGLVYFELPGVTGWLFLAAAAIAMPMPVERPLGPALTDLAVSVWAPIGAAVCHSVAWSTTNAPLRATASSVVVLAVVGFAVVAVLRQRDVGPLTISQLGAAVALVMLTVTLLMEIVQTTAEMRSTAPAGWTDARGPSTAALAVIVGMSAVEHGLRREPRTVDRDVFGNSQMLLFGVGWVALIAGSGSDSLTVQVASVGLHALAVTLFLVRLAPLVTRSTMVAVPQRWFVFALLFAAAYIGLLGHVVLGLVDERYVDASSIPSWLELGIDLAAFSGLAGSVIIGMALQSVRTDIERRLEPAAFALFVGGNLGAVVTVAAGWDPGARIGWVAIAVGCLIASVASTLAARP